MWGGVGWGGGGQKPKHSLCVRLRTATEVSLLPYTAGSGAAGAKGAATAPTCQHHTRSPGMATATLQAVREGLDTGTINPGRPHALGVKGSGRVLSHSEHVRKPLLIPICEGLGVTAGTFPSL